MTIFASDDFAGTSNQELALHNAKWSKVSGFADDLKTGVQGEYMYAPAGRGVYQHADAPSGADYSVFAKLCIRNTSGVTNPVIGVAGRIQTTGLYAGLYFFNNKTIRLLKYQSSTWTQIGSSYDATGLFDAGVVNNFELRMVGSTISLHLNGTQVISQTDTAFVAKGLAGIIGEGMRVTGQYDSASVDDWYAEDPSAPPVAKLDLNALPFKRHGDGSIIGLQPVTLWIHDATSGALLLMVTGGQSDADGIVPSPSGVVMTAGTTYRLHYKFNSGEFGAAYLPAVAV